MRIADRGLEARTVVLSVRYLEDYVLPRSWRNLNAIEIVRQQPGSV